MGKNLVRESFYTDTSWTAPAGVTKVRVLTFGRLASQIGGSHVPTLDGTLYAWGLNTNGQLGDLTIVPKSSPVIVIGPNPFWMSVSGGSVNALAITNQGDAYGWGLNTKGAVGDGSVVAKSSPTLIVGGYKWRRVSASATCLGIDNVGNAYGWGDNTNGGVGDLTVVSKSSPVLVSGGKSWYQVAAGNGPCIGITTDKNAYAWGLNTNGQLGVGDVTARSSPVLVLGSKVWAQVAAAQANCYGIDQNGVAYAWGKNDFGQVGDGTVTAKSSPILVLGGLTFRKIVASGTSVLGLTTTGSIYGWGGNANGQLGNGGVIPRSSPVLVLGGFTYSDVGVIQGTGTVTAYGLATNGNLYAWGDNTNGEIGDGTVVPKSSPILVLGGKTFRAVQKALVNESIITVVPGTSYAVTLSTSAIALFGSTSLYSFGSGAMPVEVTLEYEA